jgi:hypothetical protein
MVQHLDPDRLVLLALDEAASDAVESGHVGDCAACRAEIDALREVAAISAETQEVRDLPAPPEAVWQRIAADVQAGAGAARTDAPAVTAAIDTSTPTGTSPTDTSPTDASAPTDTARSRGRRDARRQRRWPGWIRPTLLAAAAAVLAVAGTLAVTGLTERTVEPDVTARADLTALDPAPPGAVGSARVLADSAEDRLHLHVTGLPLTTGYYEVWLINPTTEQMISVGTLGRAADALLPLPDTVNLNAYRLVDVSAERYDNQPGHSGVSLLRGTLTG